MKIFQRTLFRQLASSIMLVALILFCVAFFFDLLYQLSNFAGALSYLNIVAYALLSNIAKVYELFPFAALIGSIWLCARWVDTSQFIAWRSAGLSPLQAVTAFGKVSLLFAFLLLIFGELIAPLSNYYAQSIILSQPKAQVAKQVWLRDQPEDLNQTQSIRTIRVGGIDESAAPGFRYTDWSVMVSRHGKLTEWITAARGEFIEEGEPRKSYWKLYTVKRIVYPQNSDEELRIEPYAEWQFETNAYPQILKSLQQETLNLNIVEMSRYLFYLARNHQQSHADEVMFWKKLQTPLSVVVLMLLALPIAYSRRRAGGVGRSVLTGTIIGIVFIAITNLSVNISAFNAGSALMSLMLPLLLMFVLTMLFLYVRIRA